MKKYLLCLLCLILIGCHHSASIEKRSDKEEMSENSNSEITSNQEESSSSNKENESDSPINNPDSQLNHEQVLSGDFSSIVGEYVNSEGKSIFLDEDGLMEGEIARNSPLYVKNSFYQMGIYLEGTLDGGYTLSIYPVGIDVPDLKTDTTKIRIAYGQDYPMSDEEIYTKK